MKPRACKCRNLPNERSGGSEELLRSDVLRIVFADICFRQVGAKPSGGATSLPRALLSGFE